MSTGLRAFGDLRLSYDMRSPTKVLKADATDDAAYVEFDNGSGITSFWIEQEVAFYQAILDFWNVGDVAVDVLTPVTAALANARPAGVDGTGGSGIFWSPSDTDISVTGETYHTLKYHRDGTAITLFVDGTQFRSQTTAAAAARYFRFGLMAGIGEDYASYTNSVKIGTTEGGSEIFEDTLEDGTLDAWTTTSGAVSVVNDPF